MKLDKASTGYNKCANCIHVSQFDLVTAQGL